MVRVRSLALVRSGPADLNLSVPAEPNLFVPADLIFSVPGDRSFSCPADWHLFVPAEKKLQGGLGNLNDMRVHLEQARDFARASTAAQKAFAIGCLIGCEESSATDIFAETIAAGKRLRKAA